MTFSPFSRFTLSSFSRFSFFLALLPVFPLVDPGLLQQRSLFFTAELNSGTKASFDISKAIFVNTPQTEKREQEQKLSNKSLVDRSKGMLDDCHADSMVEAVND